MKRKDSIFKEVPITNRKLNHFDLSHEVKTSGKFGYLYPMLVKDTIPGDVFTNETIIQLRFAPMLAPIYHKVNVTTHFFFVPFRILSEEWENFITGGRDGTLQPVLPFITVAGVAASSPVNMSAGTLWDHMGLPIAPAVPPGVWSDQSISVFPFWAYCKIFNDWYKDPNFQDDIDMDSGLQGDISASFMAKQNMFLRRKGWRKDYFTSALDAPQRGPAVLIPIAGSGSVTYMPQSQVLTQAGANAAVDTLVGVGPAVPGGMTVEKNTDVDPGTSGRIENIQGVSFTNSSFTINDFRIALATQAWLEANARGGYRYIDQIDQHFDVKIPDYRLQRSEYLGGGRQPVRVSEVLSTASADNETGEGVGIMAGHGISVGRTNKFHYRCLEHGLIIGIVSIGPDSSYQQGLDRLWTKTTKFEFAFPSLAHLGEQSILNKEVFFSFDDADQAQNDTTFGYTPRYAEYKFQNDLTTGDMRTTLDFWTLSRIFTAPPVLDEIFTTMDEQGTESDEDTMRRIFQVEDGTDYLWIQMFHILHAKRPLPYFGVPRILG